MFRQAAIISADTDGYTDTLVAMTAFVLFNSSVVLSTLPAASEGLELATMSVPVWPHS